MYGLVSRAHILFTVAGNFCRGSLNFRLAEGEAGKMYSVDDVDDESLINF